MISAKYLLILLTLVPLIRASDEKTNDNATGEEATKILNDLSPVGELVDMICQCQIEDACDKPAEGSNIDPLNPLSLPRDCFDILQLGQTRSDQYDIYPLGVDGAVRVYCDMTTDGGGWTVFQRRQDATLDFYRDWQDYKTGFGSPGGNFWLGNDNLYYITNQATYELRVDLTDFDGASKFANYDHFRVADETFKYKLNVGTYSGTVGDSMTGAQHGSYFTTKDVDNDVYGTNCAEKYKGGWWYKNCYDSNLNGIYHGKGTDNTHTGNCWRSFRGTNYPLKFVDMKTRPVSDAN